ncbi:MAG: hypothetical protein H6736_11330 [Alphaproteobacteria bacterium]|nr:hypothetical protein [Alphaproteobacteria bacterium]
MTRKVAKKQAVVVVHGMGEQRPMRTVRAFVDAVWLADRSLTVLAGDGEKRVWVRPDARFASHELSRIRTNRLGLQKGLDGRVGPGPATDFYEFYWQHLMGPSRWRNVVDWLVPLLWRRLGRVPVPLRSAWYALWVIVCVVLFCFVDGLLSKAGLGLFEPVFGEWATAMRMLVAFVSALIGVVGGTYGVLPYLGDAARYLDDAPGNVAARQSIRAEGLRLLRALHESGEYDRIVLVGHSLGSVIAYDVLRLLWAEAELFDGEPPAEVAALEVAAVALRERPSRETRDAWLDAQRRLVDVLRREDRWLVTDLVTLGSPLAHAEVFLARDRADLDGLVEERGLPVSPPVLEGGRVVFARPDGTWHAHHGAPFAAVRWTNLYFPYDGALSGDLVGGPVRGLFGAGVLDVPVRSSRVGGLRCHVHYWRVDDNMGEHIVELQRAVDLGRASWPA